ncbi:isoamyl acetate-hydrolyzing esterase 1-like protein [Nannochloropsis oceanica]
MLSSSSMPVSSARDLMHNNSNDAMVIWGSRIWGLRALGLAVGVAGVLLLALVITGEDSSNNRSNSNKSKFILTDVGARFSGMNEKGTLDTNDDNLPAGHMLNDDRPYITLFGDSITQYGWNPALLGYASLLAHTYTRCADVKNRGASGYTTRDAVRVLDSVFPLGPQSWVQAHPPALVVILLGSNDQIQPGMWVEATTGEDHHVPLAEYTANYRCILTHLRTLQVELPLILVTPPPVGEDVKSARTNGAIKEYREVVLSLGKEEGIPVFDLWKACEGEDVEKFNSYLVDGLHLNGAGNTVLYKGLMGVVGKHYPDLLPEGTKMPKRERDPWEA